ncbi:MAG: N-acetylmuramoyl-L-alanine amidase [Candidatus Woesearchaeota archaeon]
MEINNIKNKWIVVLFLVVLFSLMDGSLLHDVEAVTWGSNDCSLILKTAGVTTPFVGDCSLNDYDTANSNYLTMISTMQSQNKLHQINFAGTNIYVNAVTADKWIRLGQDIQVCSTSLNYPIIVGDNFCCRTIDQNGNNAYDSSTDNVLSNHAYGNAVDININKNAYYTGVSCDSTKCDIPSCIVQAIKNNGFSWGGTYSNKCDAQHIEWTGSTNIQDSDINICSQPVTGGAQAGSTAARGSGTTPTATGTQTTLSSTQGQTTNPYYQGGKEIDEVWKKIRDEKLKSKGLTGEAASNIWETITNSWLLFDKVYAPPPPVSTAGATTPQTNIGVDIDQAIASLATNVQDGLKALNHAVTQGLNTADQGVNAVLKVLLDNWNVITSAPSSYVYNIFERMTGKGICSYLDSRLKISYVNENNDWRASFCGATLAKGKFRYRPQINIKRPVSQVVIHYTAGSSVKGAYDEWVSNDEPASAHYIIDRSGNIYYVVDEGDIAYHVATDNNNLKSIGIELVNYGFDCSKYTDCTDFLCTSADHSATVDCNEPGALKWQTYTNAQMDALIKLSKDIKSRYNLNANANVFKSHEELDPDRKKDPGPFFVWSDLERK